MRRLTEAFDRRREELGVLALALAAFLAYLPCLNGAQLWDDEAYITRFSLQGFDGLLRLWTEPGVTLQYYPLLYSAFWAEHRMWGDWVTGYHLMNVAQHVCGAYLLIRVLRFLNVRGAWLAGFIFALHPVCTEGVAWIAEQKSTLSGVFCFGAALAYLHFDRSRERFSYLIGLSLFVMALLSKTVTATLPAALLLILWWRRGELHWKPDVRPLLPWLFTGAAAGIGSAWMERHFVGATGSDFALTFVQRFELAGRALWFYAAKVVWPSNLTFIYPHWTIDARVWWQWLFTLSFLALLGLLAIVARRNRAPLTAALFFAGTLFPALGFLNVYPFRYSYVADHFQYLACVGIIVPAAWLLSGVKKGAGIGIAAMLVAGLGVLTWRQAHMYTDPLTLYRTTLQRNPSCWMADNNLGILLSKDPAHRDEALADIRAAIRSKPDYYEAWNNLGSVVDFIPGRQLEAMDDFRGALRIKSDYPEAHFNLANEYFKQQNLPAALVEYRAALHAKQDFPQAHTNLGAMLVRDPAHLQEGLDELRTAAKEAPGFIPARMNLAAELTALPGHTMEAQIEYEEIIRLAPRLATARVDLGYLLLKNDDGLAEAVAQFRAAVALAPQAPETHVGLAAALFRVPGKSDEAVRHLETALKLKPDLEAARQMLKVANAGLQVK